MKLTERLLRSYFVVSVCLICAGLAIAQFSHTALNAYLLNQKAGELTVGTTQEFDMNLCVDQGDTANCWIMEAADGDLIPDTDSAYDIGSSAVRPANVFADKVTSASITAGVQGTAFGFVVLSGANTACDTTCGTRGCLFGVNNAATEADIVNCDSATADECLCAGN